MGVPKALWAVCGKAMAKDPAGRYAGAGELAREVERYLADEPVTAMREPPSARVRRWVRKHPGVTSAGAMAGLLLLAFLGVGFVVVAGFNRDLAAANAAESDARARAEANFDAARSAVERYLVMVTGDEQLQGAEFTGLRRRLLELAELRWSYLRLHPPALSPLGEMAKELAEHLRAKAAPPLAQRGKVKLRIKRKEQR